MDFPTLEEVNGADRLQICRWWRFLPHPENDEERLIMTRIAQRYANSGGMSPEISKRIGHP